MTKEHIIAAAIEIIKEEAAKRNLIITDKGTGHAFDNTLWKGVAKDDSEIPNIIAETEGYDWQKANGYQIELRSFWGSPEIDIRDGHTLLCLTYSDSVYGEDKITHDGDFMVHQVRVDSYYYIKGLEEIQRIIKRIEEYSYED